MTESIRRHGEYESFENPSHEGAHQQAHQQASSPVDPEWPAPPAYRPAAAQTAQQPVVEPTAVWQAQPAPAGDAGGGGDDGYENYQSYENYPNHENHENHESYESYESYDAPDDGGRPGQQPSYHGYDDETGYQTAYQAGSITTAPPLKKKRTRGPIALLAAVAIVAAAIGGGTAYGIQELTGKDDVVSTSTTSTSVVPSSKRGDVASIAASVSPSVVEINATSNSGESTGSGVIYTSDGEVITNNHVISGATSIKVKTSDGKSYTAKVVGTDSKKDLALIKMEDASGLKPATFGDSDNVQVGDQVVAIGSPEGLTGTVTSGIVSALDRDVTVSTDEGQQNQGGSGNWPFQFGGEEFNGDTGSSTTTYKAIQTDASLNPGNSGGALIDANGNIIGINSAMYSASSGSSSSDAGSVGLGFAIPINTVKADLAKLRSGSNS